MKKKIIASIVVLTLLFGMLPIYSQATDELRNPRIIDNVIKTISLGNGYYSTYYNQPCVTWDCVYFGSYWQKDSDGNIDKTREKQPIKWRVLSVDGDDLFLLADDILSENMRYTKNNDGTWENSIVRNWIQTDFIPNAFTEDEQNDIIDTNTTIGDKLTIDKVFCISKDEIETKKYGFKEKNGGHMDAWWLRYNEESSYDTSHCAYETYYYASIGIESSHGIRPALLKEVIYAL